MKKFKYNFKYIVQYLHKNSITLLGVHIIESQKPTHKSDLYLRDVMYG